MKARTEDSAERILKAAEQEFAKYGLEGARVDRIAKKASANKAMIYYHFRSKDKLYRTVIEKKLSYLHEFIRNNLDNIEDPDRIFRNFAEFYISIFDEIRGFLPILLREIIAGGENIKRLLQNPGGVSPAELLTGTIQKGIESGHFRDIDVRQTALSFVGMNLFYLMMSPVAKILLEIENEDEFKKARAAAVADLFLNGLRVRNE